MRFLKKLSLIKTLSWHQQSPHDLYLDVVISGAKFKVCMSVVLKELSLKWLSNTKSLVALSIILIIKKEFFFRNHVVDISRKSRQPFFYGQHFLRN